MIDPSSSIPELIKFIKHSFRESEFDEVQNTLMEREKSMKVEMEKLVRDCDELKKQVDFLERSLGYSELEKCDLEEKLRESQKRGDELDKMLVQTNEKFEKLREKHDVENELVRSIGKYEETDERLIKMGKEIEELRRESLSANKTIEELKAKEIEADRVAQELKRQNNETAPTDIELEKNMQNGEVNPEEDRATESPEFPAISGSHLSVMQSGGEVPAEKTVASSSAAGKVAIVICDSYSDDETCIPDTSSGQTKRRKISTSATPSNCRSLPSSRVEERAGALQKSRTGHRIDSTDSDDSISAGYTNNLIATIESKGNNKKVGTAALPPPRCPLLSPHCSLAPSRCTTPVVEVTCLIVEGTGISATPETPQASSSSRARRPRGSTAAHIRANSTKEAHGRIVFQRMPNCTLMEPVGLAKACTKAFKRVDNPGGYTWRLTPPVVKDLYFDELQKEFAWSPEDELLVRAMWEQKASKRYSDMMSDYKRKLRASTDEGREMDRPLWMSAEFWTGLQAYWSQEAVQAVSQRARANRMSEPDGPGTGISRHVGGSQSTRILQQSLSLETGLPPAAQNYNTFLRLHMREDGTFLSPRDERLDAEIRRIAVETGREDRLPEIYLEVVRPDRSRLYGTGSAGRNQVSRGST